MAAGMFEQVFEDSSLMGTGNGGVGGGGRGIDIGGGGIGGGGSSRSRYRNEPELNQISCTRCGTETDISRLNAASLTASLGSSLSNSGGGRGTNQRRTGVTLSGESNGEQGREGNTESGRLTSPDSGGGFTPALGGDGDGGDQRPLGMNLAAFASFNNHAPAPAPGAQTGKNASPATPCECQHGPPKRDGGGGIDGGGAGSPRRSGINQTGYKVIGWEELGNLTYLTEGAMCRIYSAEYGGTKVAVKIVRTDCENPKQAAHDLEVELDVLKRVNHKHIITLVGAGIREENPYRFLVLEFLELGTLADKLEDDSPTGERKDSTYARRQKRTRRYQHFYMVTMLERSLELAQALEHLHHQAPDTFIVHRDLKPDNVGFKADGTLKLFDFGLARVVSRTRVNARYEMTGETGSMRYMAPEVVESLPYNEKVDVYAFGLLLWEMLEYRRVFDGMDLSDFYSRVVNGGARPALDPSWPQDLRKLIMQCWHADVDRRPNFRTIAERLQALYSGEKHSSKLCLSALNLTEDEHGRLRGGSAKSLVRSATTTQIVGGTRGPGPGTSTQAPGARKKGSGLLKSFSKTVGRMFANKKGGAKATLTHTAPEAYNRSRSPNASAVRFAVEEAGVGSGASAGVGDALGGHMVERSRVGGSGGVLEGGGLGEAQVIDEDFEVVLMQGGGKDKKVGKPGRARRSQSEGYGMGLGGLGP